MHGPAPRRCLSSFHLFGAEERRNGALPAKTITDLSSPGAQSLIVRFNPAARGALLEV